LNTHDAFAPKQSANAITTIQPINNGFMVDTLNLFNRRDQPNCCYQAVEKLDLPKLVEKTLR